MKNKIKKGDYVVCNEYNEKECEGCPHAGVHICCDDDIVCEETGCDINPDCTCIKAPIEKIAVWRLTNGKENKKRYLYDM